MLILEDGSTVYESSFILDCLEIKHQKPPLFPSDPDERLAACCLDAVFICLS